MRPRPARSVHSIGCICNRCAPRKCHDRRIVVAVRVITRVLFLTAAVIAIPFIIAHTLAGMKADGR